MILVVLRSNVCLLERFYAGGRADDRHGRVRDARARRHGIVEHGDRQSLLLVASAARLRLRRTCRAALERQALNLLSRRRHGASAPVRTFAPCDSPMGARQAFSMLDVLCLRVFLMGITAKHLGLKKRVFLCPRLNRSNRLNNVLRALVSSPGELNPSGAVFKNAQFLQED